MARGASAVEGVKLARISADRVRVTNGTAVAWVVNIGLWSDASCVGWIESGLNGGSEGNRFTLRPGETAERTFAFDRNGFVHRLSADLWDHHCDDRCLDPPDAFNWLDVP